MSAMSSISGVLGWVLGAAVGKKRVVGFSSFPSSSSPLHSLRHSESKLEPPQPTVAPPTGFFQNDEPLGNGHAPFDGDGHGDERRQGEPPNDGKPLDEEEPNKARVGQGTPLPPPLPPFLPPPSRDSKPGVTFALGALEVGREDFTKVGPPKGVSVLGGLGSFVAGNPQLPPMGAENLAGRKGLAGNRNGVSVKAGVGDRLDS